MQQISSVDPRFLDAFHTPPHVQWDILIPDKHYRLQIGLPHENYIHGTLTYEPTTSAYLMIEMIEVHPELRGKGIGTKLMHAFAFEGIQYGATLLNGYVTSKPVLRVRAKVFGRDNLVFYDHFTGERINRTYDQLMLSPEIDCNVATDLRYFAPALGKRPTV